MITDPILEQAIDQIGRRRVFDRAVSLGWWPESPPAAIWWCIVKQLEGEDSAMVSHGVADRLDRAAGASQ